MNGKGLRVIHSMPPPDARRQGGYELAVMTSLDDQNSGFCLSMDRTPCKARDSNKMTRKKQPQLKLTVSSEARGE
jgi:hypothetical protein